jgi:hypothetical protein
LIPAFTFAPLAGILRFGFADAPVLALFAAPAPFFVRDFCFLAAAVGRFGFPRAVFLASRLWPEFRDLFFAMAV